MLIFIVIKVDLPKRYSSKRPFWCLTAGKPKPAVQLMRKICNEGGNGLWGGGGGGIHIPKFVLWMAVVPTKVFIQNSRLFQTILFFFQTQGYISQNTCQTVTKWGRVERLLRIFFFFHEFLNISKLEREALGLPF